MSTEKIHCSSKRLIKCVHQINLCGDWRVNLLFNHILQLEMEDSRIFALFPVFVAWLSKFWASEEFYLSNRADILCCFSMVYVNQARFFSFHLNIHKKVRFSNMFCGTSKG